MKRKIKEVLKNWYYRRFGFIEPRSVRYAIISLETFLLVIPIVSFIGIFLLPGSTPRLITFLISLGAGGFLGTSVYNFYRGGYSSGFHDGLNDGFADDTKMLSDLKNAIQEILPPGVKFSVTPNKKPLAN